VTIEIVIVELARAVLAVLEFSTKRLNRTCQVAPERWTEAANFAISPRPSGTAPR
jgi:hypothetical protein